MSNPVGAVAVYAKQTNGSNAAVGITGVVNAAGTLTLAGNAVAGETVTIGNRVYTFAANVNTQTGNLVLIGASASDSIDNLIDAINRTPGRDGSKYSFNTAINSFVTAAAGAGDTMVVTARQEGADGNSTPTTETMSQGSWGATTLTGGASGALLVSSTGSVNGSTVIGIQETRTPTKVSATDASYTIPAGALSYLIVLSADFTGTYLTVPITGAMTSSLDDNAASGNTLPAIAITRAAGSYSVIEGRPS